MQVLFLQGHSSCFGRKSPSSGVFKTSTAATGTRVIVVGQSSHLLIRRCDDWPTTITHVTVAAVLVLNTPDDGRLSPKHVEWPCRNKTCTVLHQVGVSFDHDVTVTNFREISQEGVAWIHTALLIAVAQKTWQFLPTLSKNRCWIPTLFHNVSLNRPTVQRPLNASILFRKIYFQNHESRHVN